MSSSLDDLEPFEIFQNELDEYLKEYLKYISTELEITILLHHSFVINSFIEFICFHHALSNFESITPALVGSEFTVWINQAEDEKLQHVAIRKILKGYFEYIYKNHSIKNKELMKALQE